MPPKRYNIMDGVEPTLLPHPSKLAQQSNLTEPTMNITTQPAPVKPMRRPRAPNFNKVPTNLDTGPLSGGGAMVGCGMSAPLLKQFIDYSYLGNTSIAPPGYSIDAPLSDSRVKVYTKNGSNDKDVVVTHRGSVGLDDWMDNASYMFRGKVKGTKTYNLHRDRHKRAIDKYGASNIIAIGHSRAGLYLQELQKEFPIKENITYNKASGFTDIGRQNAANQTDVRVGNDIVSLLAPLQRRPNKIVKIEGTKNPFDFNTAHQTAEIDKVGDQFIGKQEGSGRKRGRPRKVGGIIDQATGLQATPLPPLTNQEVENMLRQMDPNDVRRIPLDPLRDWIRTMRVVPTGQDLFNAIYFAGMTGYIPRPLERAFIGEGVVGSGRKRGRPRKVGGMINQDDALQSTKETLKTPRDINERFIRLAMLQREELRQKVQNNPYDYKSYDKIEALNSRIKTLEAMKNPSDLTTPSQIMKALKKRELMKPPTVEGGFTNKQLTKVILDKNKVIGDLEETAYGKDKFSNKQLTKIILDKNKVIGDLEETAYKGSGRKRGGMMNPPHQLLPYPQPIEIDNHNRFRRWLRRQIGLLRMTVRHARSRSPDVVGVSLVPDDRKRYFNELLTHYEHLQASLNTSHHATDVYNNGLPETYRILSELHNRGVTGFTFYTNSNLPPPAPTPASPPPIDPHPPAPPSSPNAWYGYAEGSGTLPVISSVEGIKRLIATEQARLRKIKKGYKYESPTMSQDKIEEKIARLKERLKSAKANKGHADVSYFIPKSIKWLKIMAGETRVGSDAYNKQLLEAVKKLLAELSGKKPTAANKKKTATLEEDRDNLEKLISPKKKGYSKKNPDANKPAPVIIPPSSITNERGAIRAAVQRQKTYNKIIDDKQQEDFKVILKAMAPDQPLEKVEPNERVRDASRSKEDLRKERAREAARRQRERDKPSGFTQAQEYNKATKQRQTKAKEYGIPTREYTASLKQEAKLKAIEEGLEDEDKKKVIREERNKLRAKYTYLDEIMNSDNTDANMANAASMGAPPELVEPEVEPPLAGAGMYGGSMCGGGSKYVLTPKTEEYNLLH